MKGLGGAEKIYVLSVVQGKAGSLSSHGASGICSCRVLGVSGIGAGLWACPHVEIAWNSYFRKALWVETLFQNSILIILESKWLLFCCPVSILFQAFWSISPKS